jgi:hypothetical protein
VRSRGRAPSHGCWSADARWWWCEEHRQGICVLVPRMRGAQGTGKASVPSFVVSTFSRSVCALVAHILHKCTNRDGVRSSTHERMTVFAIDDGRKHSVHGVFERR